MEAEDRMKKYVIILIGSIIVAPLAFAADVTPEQIREVHLTHSVGWVGGLYAIRLNADGSVIYEGGHYVSKLGVFQSTLPKDQFRKLAELLVAENFLSLKDRYDAGVRDGATFRITVAGDGFKTKTIGFGKPSRAPVQVWAIRKVIESLVVDLEWRAAGKRDASSFDLNKITIPHFRIPDSAKGQRQGDTSVRRFVEYLCRCSREADRGAADPLSQGVNIVLELPDALLNRGIPGIDMKYVSVAQLLNHVASFAGLELSIKDRIITIRKRKGSL